MGAVQALTLAKLGTSWGSPRYGGKPCLISKKTEGLDTWAILTSSPKSLHTPLPTSTWRHPLGHLGKGNLEVQREASAQLKG